MEWITLSEQGGHCHASVNSVMSTSFLKKGKLWIAWFSH